MDRLTAKIEILKAVDGDMSKFNSVCAILKEELDAAPLSDNVANEALGAINQLFKKMTEEMEENSKGVLFPSQLRGKEFEEKLKANKENLCWGNTFDGGIAYTARPMTQDEIDTCNEKSKEE